MTTRPLMQHGVGQLEALFTNSKGDVKALKQLEGELRHRQVPRAVALLERVQAVLRASGGTQVAPPSEPLDEGELWGDQPAIVNPPGKAGGQVEAPPGPASPRAKPAPVPIPEISVANAYRLLKAGPGSTWETIEQQRRELVQASSPSRMKDLDPQRQTQLRDEARFINAAYEVISRARAEGKSSVGNAADAVQQGH